MPTCGAVLCYRFDALYVIPVFQSFWIVVSVISGMVFFGEYEDMSGEQIMLFAIGVGVTVFGVFYLSGRSIGFLPEVSVGVTVFGVFYLSGRSIGLLPEVSVLSTHCNYFDT